jgi:hypothetical protein
MRCTISVSLISPPNVISVYPWYLYKQMQTPAFLSSLFLIRCFTRQITHGNKIEGKRERQQLSPGFSLIDLQANYLNAQKSLCWLLCLIYLLILFVFRCPGIGFQPKPKTKKKNRKGKYIYIIPGTTMTKIQLVHSSSIVALILHSTNFSFVFADLNLEKNSTKNKCYDKNKYWDCRLRKTTPGFVTFIHSSAHNIFVA